METVIIIISAVAALLQIILFFKVWAMTNNVKRIRKKFILGKDDYKFEIRKLLARGEKQKVADLLEERFYNLIEKEYYSDSYFDDYRGFDDYKEEVVKQYEEIGVEIPDRIKNMKSVEDFRNLFK